MTPSQISAEVDVTLRRTSKALKDATVVALRDAGKLARTNIQGTGRGPTGGDLRFSNMAGYNHGGRIGVKLRTKKIDSLIEVVPSGPWKLAETGAAPHAPGHPGTTQGTAAWSRGRDDTFARLESEIPRRIEDETAAAFGG